MNTDIYASADYKTSARAYTAQCAFEYFISILSCDAFLAKLLKDIGISDALTGLISSLISVTFFFQLLSLPLAGKLKSVKKPITALDTASQLLFASLYLVPFVPAGTGVKAVFAVAIILSAYFTLYLNTAVCYKWGNSFVSPEKRGDFSATKEMISLVSGVFFTLGSGFVIDRFEADGDLHGGFRFLAAAMVVVCACNFICLTKMKDVPLAESGAKQTPKEIYAATLGQKYCRRAMLLTSLSDFAKYFTIGFMGTYKTQDLGFPVGTIQFINVAGNMARFAISKPFGRFSDRHTYSDGYFYGNVILLLTFLSGIFTTPKTRWLILPFTLGYNMSQAGTSQNTYNMMYCFTSEEYILPAMAVNNSLRGAAGFIASLFGSYTVKKIQAEGNTFFGISVRAQQVLCGVSALLTGIALVYNKKIVSKQPQEKK